MLEWWIKAKQLVGKMLFEGIGDYFETMNLYLMLLVQVHKYDEVVSVIEELLVSETVFLKNSLKILIVCCSLVDGC